jgi:hypothetical protein
MVMNDWRTMAALFLWLALLTYPLGWWVGAPIGLLAPYVAACGLVHAGAVWLLNWGQPKIQAWFDERIARL